MSYLLDTNAVIAVLRDRPTAVREHLRKALTASAAVAISSIVLFELRYGVARSRDRAKNAKRLRIFLSGAIEVLPFDDSDAEHAGELRAELEAQGNLIGPYDLLIAAQGVRRGMTVVTGNVAEFARVSGLAWTDWTAPREHPPSPAGGGGSGQE